MLQEVEDQLIFFKWKDIFSRTAALALLVSIVLLMFDFTVFADSEITAKISASDKIVHSGAEFTLSVELSSAPNSDVAAEIETGKKTLQVTIPAGETKGSIKIKAGKHSRTSLETYSVKSNAAFVTEGRGQVEVKVLPKPEISFNASFIMAVVDKKVYVYFKCKNASEMSVPLPISLRTNEGKILKKFTVDSNNSSFQYALTVEKDWVLPYALKVYNEITGSVCVSIPVMVTDLNRSGIRKVETTEKKIALGFDCGYNNVYTDYILDMLDEYDAKATFFVTGFFCKGFPEQLKKIHERGHEIGNHTMNHLRMNTLSLEEVYEEIKGVNDMVYENIGIYPVIMRPPYGNANTNVVAISRMAGCETVFWTMDSYDWDPEKSADFIIKRATEGMGEGCILLFHNSAPKTKKTLKTILEDYKAKGLKIVSISELLYDGHYLIDEKGTQKLDPDYQQVKGDELLSAGNYTVTVSGNETQSKIAVKPVFNDESVSVKKKDIEKIQKDSSLIEVRYDFGDTVSAPVKYGDHLGQATFSYNNEVWFTADMIAQSDVAITGRIPEDAPEVVREDISLSEITDDSDFLGIPFTLAINIGILLLAFLIMIPAFMQNKQHNPNKTKES